MGTKGTTVNSTIFNNKQIMKNQESLGPVIKAAGNGMQRGMSHGADSNGIGRYANGGSYSPAKMMKNQGEGVGNETNNLLEDNPVAETMSGSYSNPGNTKSNPSFGGKPSGAFDVNTYAPKQSSSFTQKVPSAPTLSNGLGGGMNEAMSQGRSQSKSIYNAGVDSMNAGKTALASARSMTTGPGSASNSERRTALKDARSQIKAGRKERNSSNKATVIRSEFGKTRVNNRAANAAAGGGTKVGNLIRDVFGGRKKPSKLQNRI